MLPSSQISSKHVWPTDSNIRSKSKNLLHLTETIGRTKYQTLQMMAFRNEHIFLILSAAFYMETECIRVFLLIINYLVYWCMAESKTPRRRKLIRYGNKWTRVPIKILKDLTKGMFNLTHAHIVLIVVCSYLKHCVYQLQS